jgi:hypothetical protein
LARRRGSSKRCSFLECRAILSIYFVDVNRRPWNVVGPRAVLCIRDRYAFAGRQRIAKLSPDQGVSKPLNAFEEWPVLRIVPSLPCTEERSMSP